MEIYHDEYGSGSNVHNGFVSRLQVVMSFFKRLINRFKVTPQDLRDAAVYRGRTHE